MITDLAYLGRAHEDIIDNSKPLLITAVGHYRVEKTYKILTKRRLGRKDYQLLYVAKGKAHFYFDGKERVINEGNMVLFHPDQPQMYDLYAKDKPETYWVHFTGYEAEQVLEHYSIPNQSNVFYAGLSPDYIWIFGQMIRELRMQRYNYEELLTLNFKNLLLIIERYLNEGDIQSAERFNEVERAIHYFNENYNKQIVIEDYAREHFIKPCNFIVNFRRVTNQTPMQYIVSLRIAKSIELLTDTKLNISQISAAVGYNNALYFSRLFHKHTGMSPTEYRKSINDKNKRAACAAYLF